MRENTSFALYIHKLCIYRETHIKNVENTVIAKIVSQNSVQKMIVIIHKKMQ